MDLAAYDNYPVWGGSLQPTSPAMVALQLDRVRGWGQYDAPSRSFGGFMSECRGARTQ